MVTFKSHTPKSEVYELSASGNILSMYRVRYIGITSEDAQLYLNQSGNISWIWQDFLCTNIHNL